MKRKIILSVLSAAALLNLPAGAGAAYSGQFTDRSNIIEIHPPFEDTYVLRSNSGYKFSTLAGADALAGECYNALMETPGITYLRLTIDASKGFEIKYKTDGPMLHAITSAADGHFFESVFTCPADDTQTRENYTKAVALFAERLGIRVVYSKWTRTSNRAEAFTYYISSDLNKLQFVTAQNDGMLERWKEYFRKEQIAFEIFNGRMILFAAPRMLYSNERDPSPGIMQYIDSSGAITRYFFENSTR